MFLDGVNDSLKVVINAFRTKKFKKWIGNTCPKICPTRWTNLYDILFFMMKNKKRLVCILNTENPIVSREVDGFRSEFEQVLFNYLPNLFIFMFFFQKLIGILERDYTLAAECPMIYQHFFLKVQHYIETMNDNHINILGKLFINSIKKRLLNTGNFHLLLFLSSFTIDGRNLIRENFANIEIISQDNYQISPSKNYFPFSDDEVKDINEFIEYFRPSIMTEKNEYFSNRNTLALIEILQNSDDEYYGEYDDDFESDEILINKAHSAMIEFSEDDDTWPDNESQEESCDINVFENYSPIEYSHDFLKGYSSRNDLPDDDYLKINNAYIQWIIQPIENTIIWTDSISSVHDMWVSLSFNKKWREISNIAIKYLSIASSEASAERMFSKQRFAISKHRYRTKKKLEESRMIY